MVSLSSTVAPKAGEKQENVHKTSQGSQTRSLGWSDGCINTYSKMCNWMDGEGNRWGGGFAGQDAHSRSLDHLISNSATTIRTVWVGILLKHCIMSYQRYLSSPEQHVALFNIRRVNLERHSTIPFPILKSPTQTVFTNCPPTTNVPALTRSQES